MSTWPNPTYFQPPDEASFAQINPPQNQYFPETQDRPLDSLSDLAQSEGIHHGTFDERQLAVQDPSLAIELPLAHLSLRRSKRFVSSPLRTPIYCEAESPDDLDDVQDTISESGTTAKRPRDDDCEYAEQPWPSGSTTKPRKRSRVPTRRRKALTVHCTLPGCSKTFTRENDLKRHQLCASVHEADRPLISERLNVALPSSRCEICGENLSRPDAQLRHKRDRSCGKRPGRKIGTKATATIAAARE